MSICTTPTLPFSLPYRPIPRRGSFDLVFHAWWKKNNWWILRHTKLKKCLDFLTFYFQKAYYCSCTRTSSITNRHQRRRCWKWQVGKDWSQTIVKCENRRNLCEMFNFTLILCITISNIKEYITFQYSGYQEAYT